MLRSYRSLSAVRRPVSFDSSLRASFCTAAEAKEEKPERKPFSVPPKLALPQFVNGRWRSPRLSARKVADIKKSFVETGEEWVDPRPWKQNQGRRPYKTLEQCKGHKWDRNKEAKLQKIEENMKKMPELIRKYHREERERKIKTYDEEHWLYPHEIKRFQKKKSKKKKPSGDDEYDTYSRTDQEANDEHSMD